MQRFFSRHVHTCFQPPLTQEVMLLLAVSIEITMVQLLGVVWFVLYLIAK